MEYIPKIVVFNPLMFFHSLLSGFSLQKAFLVVVGAVILPGQSAYADQETLVQFEQKSEVGLSLRDGIDADRDGYQNSRSAFVTNRLKLSRDSISLLWDLKWSGNRNVFESNASKVHRDEIYYAKRRRLSNGSILDRDQQLMVREAYLQVLSEGWLLQAGAIRYPWGTADFVNPVSVVNARDMRYGFAVDKDQQLLSASSVRMSRLGEGHSLTAVYVPVFETSILPSREQNWSLDLDNQKFGVNAIQDEKSHAAGNLAFKYDISIPDGDVNVIFYNGIDNELVTRPSELTVVNNQPIVLEVDQMAARKNSAGLAYQQTFNQWLLKAEGLYTTDKLVPKSFDRSQLENLDFPIEMNKSPHISSSFGFNYFLNIRDLFGLPLSETVWTTEVYTERYLRSDVTAGLPRDLLATNLRTGALEDRLEIYLTYMRDVVLAGDAKMLKASINSETLKHSINVAQYESPGPVGDDIGSPFYYWRSNDFVSYDVSFGF